MYNNDMIRNMLCFLLAVLWTGTALAQGDTAKRSVQRPLAIKKYSEVIPEGSRSQSGLFGIHRVREQVLLEIPSALLGREVLVVSRVAKGASGSMALAGDELNNLVVTFERRGTGRLLLRKKSYRTYNGDSTASTFRAVGRSELMPIIASLPIETFGRDSSVVVDATSLILSDSELFSFVAQQKAQLGLTSLVADRSFIESVASYPMNLEIGTLKTYNKSVQVVVEGQRSSAVESSTYELNTSFVLLPEVPMRPRFADPRVGYFSIEQTDFGAQPQGVATRALIKRWRLEPRPQDVERYRRGELVVPAKPIVFYIDPATPSKWVPYLIQGVNDWSGALEAAGFRDAIVAREAPSKQVDPAWSLFDARHSAVVYKPSVVENASGPSIADPRTGEILESHINWYHNVTQLIHDWYMLQCGATDPGARTLNFSDELMGELVRFVVSHEVGHTLGLMHNMGASSSVKVEDLRNAKWVEENGICPSIMDYARFNYVAQPQDKVPRKGLLPRIGPYDRWALEWGYRYLPEFGSAEAERPLLNQWVVSRTADRRLRFIGEGAFDARNVTEDLGDDAVLASAYGMANLKRVLPQLRTWTTEKGEDYTNLHHAYLMLQRQYRKYVDHVLVALGRGSVYEDLKTSDQPGPVYSPVAYQKLVSAYGFVNAHVFQAPLWLLDTAILARTGQTRLGVVGNIQEIGLRSILSPLLLNALYSRNQHSFNGQGLSVQRYLGWLRRDVFAELDQARKVDPYRKNLQKLYVKYLLEAFDRSKPTGQIVYLPNTGFTELYSSEVVSLLYAQLLGLQASIKRQLGAINDKDTRAHFQYLDYKIGQSLKKEGNSFGY